MSRKQEILDKIADLKSKVSLVQSKADKANVYQMGLKIKI